MEELYHKILLIVVGFIAGIINTLAGGGSLITLPVFIFLGLPPTIANGTNRISIVIQSLTGTLGYRSKGIFTFPFNLYLGIIAAFGAIIGAQIALVIDGRLFNKILAIIMVVVAGLLMLKSNTLKKGLPERLKGKHFVYALIGFFFIGIYGGFINAGIGIVIMLFLNRVNQLSLVKANATKVVVVAVYSTVALAFFAFNDAIDWELGLWMALGTSFGAWWASRWSVKKGDRIIRLAMIVMVSVMAVKLWFFN